jgi:hypothetical protein
VAPAEQLSFLLGQHKSVSTEFVRLLPTVAFAPLYAKLLHPGLDGASRPNADGTLPIRRHFKDEC